MEELLCKCCGNKITHEDTLDTYGCIEDGYIQEHQIWSCEKCKIDYVVDIYAKIIEPKITYFEES